MEKPCPNCEEGDSHFYEDAESKCITSIDAIRPLIGFSSGTSPNFNAGGRTSISCSAGEHTDQSVAPQTIAN